ncbi:MAG TPA: transglutaminase-like domain-containing protein [Flavisolibacter sp.]
MKTFTATLAFYLFALMTYGQTTYKGLPLIKAKSAKADFRVGSDWVKGNWIISPHIEFDSLIFPCHSNPEEFAFYTDSDSISFLLPPGEIRKFYVSLNDTSYALTVVKGIKPQLLSFDTKMKKSEYAILYEQNDNNEYLDLLRVKYPFQHLIMDARSDSEKAFKILNWVHKQWKHDGNNEPKKNDAISILDEAREGKNFRCVEYGIVATACLNAVGLKARVLGLMTKDVETTQSGAGHVLLEVYLNDLKKWVLLDGQWDAVPLLNNIPLNAVEFQKAIVENYDDLIIRSSSGISKRHYVDWIYPYLYYFTIPLDNSEKPGSEVKKKEGKTHLMLVPLGAVKPSVFQIIHKIDYCLYTHSLSDFYAPPGMYAPPGIQKKPD